MQYNNSKVHLLQDTSDIFLAQLTQEVHLQRMRTTKLGKAFSHNAENKPRGRSMIHLYGNESGTVPGIEVGVSPDVTN